MIAFGPVPSRRLGKSLGINNIPDKVCSYACVYCQIGRTLKMEIKRRVFYPPELIFEDVKKKVEQAKARREHIDYITFVPDGEPTLDINLKKEIELLKTLGIPLAILTNSSLIWNEEVREDILSFDFVSLKLDAVNEGLWKKINRPHKSLKLDEILEGMLKFKKEFKGKLITETMLIDGVSYGNEFHKIGKFLNELNPDISCIAIPTRPPLERLVKPAKEEIINQAFQAFAKSIGHEKVEYLIGYEGNEFAFTGNIEENILSITAVHPMREDAVNELLKKGNATWDIIKKLMQEKKLLELKYEGAKFYMRKLKSRELG